MASYLLPVLMFAIVVSILVLGHRNNKTLDPETYSEYLKTRFIPSGILMPALLVGVLVGGARSFFELSDLTAGILILIYGIGIFILFRSIKEKNIREANLPADFVRRERFYDFVLTLSCILTLAVVWFI